MLIEMLEILKYAVSEVVLSTIRSVQIIVTAIVYMAQIFRAEWATSGVLERVLVLVFALGIVYAAYKFFWDSAKIIVVLIAAIFLIFFMEGFFF